MAEEKDSVFVGLTRLNVITKAMAAGEVEKLEELRDFFESPDEPLFGGGLLPRRVPDPAAKAAILMARMFIRMMDSEVPRTIDQSAGPAGIRYLAIVVGLGQFIQQCLFDDPPGIYDFGLILKSYENFLAVNAASGRENLSERFLRHLDSQLMDMARE